MDYVSFREGIQYTIVLMVQSKKESFQSKMRTFVLLHQAVSQQYLVQDEDEEEGDTRQKESNGHHQ